jgi:hypothetical protein
LGIGYLAEKRQKIFARVGIDPVGFFALWWDVRMWLDSAVTNTRRPRKLVRGKLLSMPMEHRGEIDPD